MDDLNILWYIIAAVIYFLTRSKKKKQPTRPGTENNPPKRQPTKSFEELLKEITGEEQVSEELEPVSQQPTLSEEQRMAEERRRDEQRRAEQRRQEGERRAFADDESRRIYEESIKQAEGFDIEFAPDDKFKSQKLVKSKMEDAESKYTIADEIRDGLSSSEAKKAIIYSEILNRKY